MRSDAKFENIVFIVDGGIGKNIMATVPLRGIRKKYPNKQIHVVCGHPDIFLHNPNVDRVYRFTGTQYLCEDKIKTEKALIMREEPYLEYDYLYKYRHLTDIWCEMLDVPFDNPKPDIFLTKRDLRDAERFVKDTKKKILVMQVSGGIPPQPGQMQRRMYVRDIPEEIIEMVVDELKDDYLILNVRRKGQPEFKGTTPIETMLRPVMSLIPIADKLLLIDSFMQHAAAGLDKEAVVAWGGTSPVCLGYKSHVNLRRAVCKTPECHRPNSYLFDVSPTSIGNMQVMWDCPAGDACMEYRPKELVTAIDKKIGEEMKDEMPKPREFGRKKKDKEEEEAKDEGKGKSDNRDGVGTHNGAASDARVEEVDSKSGKVLSSDIKPPARTEVGDSKPNAGDALNKVGLNRAAQEAAT